MEGRDGIEIKRGDRRARPANSSKLEKILKLTWEGARGGRGHLDLLILINIPDKYSCPGVQIVVTK